MKITVFTVLLLVVALSCICESRDLIMGTSFNNRLLFQEKVDVGSIPLFKKKKEVFFSDPGQHIIKGIIARDLDHSQAAVSVTSGGLGSTYVNLKLKSDRGHGLNYQIEIYG